MNGFVLDYYRNFQQVIGEEPAFGDYRAIMEYFPCARSFKMRMTASFMVRMCGCEEGPADGSRRGLGVRGGAVVVSLP